jgi:hypothetical protein
VSSSPRKALHSEKVGAEMVASMATRHKTVNVP